MTFTSSSAARRCSPRPSTRSAPNLRRRRERERNFITTKRTSNRVTLLSLKEIEIVEFVVVLLNLLLDLACVGPGDEILHISCDEVGRVGDDIGADANMALLDVGARLFDRLAVFVPNDDDREAAAAEGGRSKLLNLGQ